MCALGTGRPLVVVRCVVVLGVCVGVVVLGVRVDVVVLGVRVGVSMSCVPGVHHAHRVRARVLPAMGK